MEVKVLQTSGLQCLLLGYSDPGLEKKVLLPFYSGPDSLIFLEFFFL